MVTVIAWCCALIVVGVIFMRSLTLQCILMSADRAFNKKYDKSIYGAEEYAERRKDADAISSLKRDYIRQVFMLWVPVSTIPEVVRIDDSLGNLIEEGVFSCSEK